MKKLREILRLRLKSKLTIRAIKLILNLSIGAIQNIVSRAHALKLTWEKVQSFDEQTLTQLFYPAKATIPTTLYELPIWNEVHKELSRKGVTRQLLWEEYAEGYPNNHYSYTQFCRRYKKWLQKQKRSMRQVHKAGEKLFVDYAGQTVPIVNQATNKIRQPTYSYYLTNQTINRSQILTYIPIVINATFHQNSTSNNFREELDDNCQKRLSR